jgi:GT2 family glycosyltransferase
MDRQPAIIIVSFNSAEFLPACLESALAQSSEVVVVDNASQDASAEVARRFPAARLIANATNEGFAAAVNQGVRSTVSAHILLLNPDAVLQTALDPLIEACTRGDVAAAAGKLIDARGDVQSGFSVRSFPNVSTLVFESLGLNRLWPSNPVNRRYRCLDLDLNRAQFVDQPAGAFLAFRRSLWEELGGFDEQFYPLWFEDVDFLFRASQKGYKTWYEPTVIALHYGGHSIAGMEPSTRQYYWYGSLLRYAAKHFHPVALRVVAAAVLAGWVARIFVGLFLRRTGSDAGRGFDSDAKSRKVLRLAGAYLWSGHRRQHPARGEVHVDGVEDVSKTKLRNSHSHGL